MITSYRSVWAIYGRERQREGKGKGREGEGKRREMEKQVCGQGTSVESLRKSEVLFHLLFFF